MWVIGALSRNSSQPSPDLYSHKVSFLYWIQTFVDALELHNHTNTEPLMEPSIIKHLQTFLWFPRQCENVREDCLKPPFKMLQTLSLVKQTIPKNYPQCKFSEEKPLPGSFSQVISHSMVAKGCLFPQQVNSRNLQGKCIMEEYAQRNFLRQISDCCYQGWKCEWDWEGYNKGRNNWGHAGQAGFAEGL